MKPPAASYGIALLVAVLAASVGPRIATPGDRPARTPFVFTPPEGFVPTTNVPLDDTSGTRTWSRATVLGTFTNPVSVSLVHANKPAPITDADLRTLAAEMPATYAGSGSTWTEVKHAVHVRADGARVGVLEGEITSPTLTHRALQIAFPDDAGMSIITASFAVAEAPRWESELDKTIELAQGVAYRAPPPPAWMYIAWGVGGFFLALLAFGLRVRAPARAR